MDKIFLDWFKVVFPSPLLNLPYSAITHKGVTYVFTMMSELEALREMVKAKAPPVPIVPVIAIDCPMPETPPKNTWVALTDKDCHWYEAGAQKEGFQFEIEVFNETIAAMCALNRLVGNSKKE